MLITRAESPDIAYVRTFILGLIATSLVMGESYPRAWNYVAPDASALVGIEWQHLRDSILSDAVKSELFSSGRLGFPDLECLWDAREILLSGPDLLAIASGNFPAATVSAQAARLGLKLQDYDGVRLWIAPEKDRRSLAQVSDSLLLIGWKETLESAIDRSLVTTGGQMSPLLTRGARLAGALDLWIAATSLPDPLVSVFVPLQLESDDFEAGLTARSGLAIDGRYSMATPEDAVLSAEYFRQAALGFHPLLRGINVIQDGADVRLKLQVTAQDLAEQMRPPPPEPAKPEAVVANPVPPQSRTVHIVGLDDGPREIQLPVR